MRNITKTGYEALTIVRSLNDPTLGFGLDISPALWINECKDTKFFVFAPQGCINQIYELSSALNDYIDGIITPCGTLIPINNKIEFLDSEGIGLECVDGKLKFVIKAPLASSLGGTGQIIYKEGDLLVGNQDGKLSILIKGEIGQVVGVKEDGSLGFITSSVTAPIQKFSVSPCGELIPDSIGKVGLELSEDFTCELSEDKSTSKIGIKQKQKISCEDTVTENALSRWNTDGTCLKNGIAIEDDLGNITQENALVNQTLTHKIINRGIGENSHANQEIRSNGDNSGDAYTHWSIDQATDWSIGIDNSDEDALKICRNYYLEEVSCFLRMNKAGILSLKNPLNSTSGGTGLNQYNKGDVLIGKEDGSLEKLPKGQIGQALGIDSNGNLAYIDVSGGGGEKKVVAATARFPVTTITWGQNNWYPLGSQGNTGYIKIRDQDGDNFQANNLKVGSGTVADYLIFTVPYSGLWAISYQATFEVNNLDRETIIQHSIAWGKSFESVFRLREFDSFSTGKRKSVVGTKILPIEKDDIIFIEVYIGRDPSDPNLQVTMRSYWNPPSFDSYVGFGLIEEGNVTAPTTEVL